ncbi:MAG: hypothetical protein ABFC62_03905 [Clostridiaceae bacterium]|nr:hypothetical protein [Eubacteriales bacterium]
MGTRINYGRTSGNGGDGRIRRPVAVAQNAAQNAVQNERRDNVGGEGGCCPKRRDLKAPFCETVTLHESFDASNITPSSVCICYDTNYLGYTLEELTVDAKLPCGGTCPMDVMRVSLTGAIPYTISAGPVTSTCGDSVALSCQGVCMVDEDIGYLCNDEDPDLDTLGCSNVTPTVDIDVDRCGCSGKTNVTFRGVFTFSNLPTTLG